MFTVPPDPFIAGLWSGLAVLIAAEYALRRAPAHGFDQRVVFRTVVVAVCGGLAGGHALYVAIHGGALLLIWQEQSVLGVLAGGALAAALALRAQGQPVLRHADAAVPGVALGYGVARVGCFLNGDDFGVVTTLPIGMHYLPGTEAWQAHLARGWIDAEALASLAVVPVQAVLAIGGFAIFATLRRITLPRGGAVAAAAVMYGVLRFLAEPLRDDYTAFAGALSLPQLVAILMMTVGCAVLLRGWAPMWRARAMART